MGRVFVSDLSALDEKPAPPPSDTVPTGLRNAAAGFQSVLASGFSRLVRSSVSGPAGATASTDTSSPSGIGIGTEADQAQAPVVGKPKPKVRGLEEGPLAPAGSPGGPPPPV